MHQLPTEAAVRELLSLVVGKDVTVRYAPSPLLDAGPTGALARYDDDAGVTRAVVHCDLLVANALGAALALVPRARVVAAVKNRTVPRDLAENLHEVFNIGANFFNAPDRPHLRLTATHTFPDLPAGLLAAAVTGSNRLDLRIEVPGYGRGGLALVSVA